MKPEQNPDTSDLKIGVQCLGKEYPAIDEAWACRNETRELHKQSTKHDTPEQQKAFQSLEQKYVNEQPANSPVQRILSGFGITDSGESPKQRMERFKADLHQQETPSVTDRLRGLARDVKSMLGY